MIARIGYEELVNLIYGARERLILCMPGIRSELAEAIAEKAKGMPEIRVIVNVDEESIRNGYGDMESIDVLRKAGVDVLSAAGNRVAFIVADERAYFLFIESRIFSDNTEVTNAVEMDRLTCARLIAHFFPPKTIDQKAQFENAVAAAARQIVDSHESLLVIDSPVDVQAPQAQTISDLKAALAINPPVHPDLQRQIKTYTAQIQFVEFSFKGMNFQAAKVAIPPQALPFKDETIRKRLEARMRLFEGLDENANFKKLYELKKEINDLRKEFLVPIASREKSIIRIEDKETFGAKIKTLTASLAAVNQDVEIWLELEIMNSRDKIKTELLTFLKENPPTEYEKYKSHGDLFDRKIDDIAVGIVAAIKFPEPVDLITKMELKVHYYDLTWSDFNNKEFLDELVKKEVFEEGMKEQIVRMQDAFETKKDEKPTVSDLSLKQ